MNGQETVGGRLRRLRLAAGLSQRELAAPGVSYAYISRIEAGTRQPSVRALRKLAAKLGVTADYLETGEEGVAVAVSASVADIDAAAARWNPGGPGWLDLTVEERARAMRGLDEALVDALAARIYAVRLDRAEPVGAFGETL